MSIRWRWVNAACWAVAIAALIPLVVHIVGIVIEFIATY
jgi:hypothetical protein